MLRILSLPRSDPRSALPTMLCAQAASQDSWALWLPLELSPWCPCRRLQEGKTAFFPSFWHARLHWLCERSQNRSSKTLFLAFFEPRVLSLALLLLGHYTIPHVPSPKTLPTFFPLLNPHWIILVWVCQSVRTPTGIISLSQISLQTLLWRKLIPHKWQQIKTRMVLHMSSTPEPIQILMLHQGNMKSMLFPLILSLSFPNKLLRQRKREENLASQHHSGQGLTQTFTIPGAFFPISVVALCAISIQPNKNSLVSSGWEIQSEMTQNIMVSAETIHPF